MICIVYDFFKNECLLIDKTNENIEPADVIWGKNSCSLYDAKIPL